MNLQLLTDATPLEKKEWANLVVYSVLSQYPSNAAVPGLSTGGWAFALDVQQSTMPAGTGGGQITYSPTLNEAVQSDLSGTNTTAFTTDGATWTQITTTPSANPTLEWSPSLGYYGYINATGTDVYTSVDHVTYVIGTPAAHPFAGLLFWSNVFNKFFAPNQDAANQIYESTDGKTYQPQATTRVVEDFAESPELKIIVAVGDSGPQYSLDGLTWQNNPAYTFDASDVAWSPGLGVFVTVPRNGTKMDCWRSKDGINWTVTHPFSGTNNIRCITWSQDYGLFIAGGDNAYLAFSPDGLTWHRSTLTGSFALYGAEYIPQWGEYMLCGISGITVHNPKFFTGTA